MVAILRPDGKFVFRPFEVPHLSGDIQTLIDQIKGLDGDTRIVMEYTGRYYEPLARELTATGLFVSAVNPKLISNCQDEDNALHRVKSDKVDSVKIAR